MSRKQNIILIGYMGTGKSTIGKACANRLGWDHVDLDAEIEKQADCKITDIFKLFGEGYFRQIETQILQESLKHPRTVIATGGGIVTVPRNMELLTQIKHGALIVWLTASPEIILKRVETNNDRPLLQIDDKLGTIKAMLTERNPLYQRVADCQIDTSALTVDQVVQLIFDLVK